MTKAPGAAEIEAALGALLPWGVEVAVWPAGSSVDGDPLQLLGPREREAVARAVPKRRIEFARGRWCAREALRKAGCLQAAVHPSPEIPVGSSREPLWPTGFTGSITHCEGLVAAFAAPLTVVRGVGLDAEPDRALPQEVVSQVVTMEEAVAQDEGLHLVRFSAKESIHKTLFPLTGAWLDFLEVALELEAGVFRARPAAGARPRAAEVRALEGRYTHVRGMVLTVSWC